MEKPSQTSPDLFKLPPLSLYIHIPWCIKKCPYCDFNSHAVKENLPESQYIDVLLDDLSKDIDLYGIGRPLGSIFIGGGTPSLFAPQSFERLLQGVARQLVFDEGIEITLEANPGTFEAGKFREFRALGINRLSVGVQSFNDALLSRLGRVHSAQEAVHAIETARQVGFDNLNIDLMFGLPQATLSCSQKDVQTAIGLEPAHISFYQLTLEPNTYFYQFPPPLPDDDAIFHIQKSGQRLLADHGYQQYEVSAYSQPGKQCRHNLNYWQFGDYLGIGAGAHGKLTLAKPGQIVRTRKPKSPGHYLREPQSVAAEAIAISDLPLEFAMNQLRLRKGFSLNAFQAMTGLTAGHLQPALGRCIGRGLMVLENGHYTCTQTGWDFLDSVLQEFLQ